MRAEEYILYEVKAKTDQRETFEERRKNRYFRAGVPLCFSVEMVPPT